MGFRPQVGMLAAVLVTAAGSAAAAPDPGGAPARRPAWRAGVERVERDQRVLVQSQNRRIDVNNINMFVTNYGTFSNDIENQGNSGLFFPKGTIRTAVYQSGIWLAGKVNGEVRAAIAEYSQEFQPGAMIGAAPDNPSKEDYTVYKVVRYAGSPSDTDHVERDPAAVGRDRTLDPLAHHSWSEYMRGAAPYGAPVRDYRFPDPNSPGDSVTVTGPDVRGDQMLWCVYNDANPASHINRGGRTAPLGVEVQQSTFGFDRQGALGNTVFLEFKVINKGGNQIDSLYIQMWSDPDLGGAGDDLVGSDTTLSLGYVYNATNTDQLYGDRPPAVGYDFFQGPAVGDSILPLTAFVYYFNGIDPQNANETYNYMRGLQRDGTPFRDHLGNETKFYASGDPVRRTGFLDTNPSDRRFMLISGPFSMAPGDTQVIVGAIVIAQGGDRLSSITGLKFFDVKAQTAFDLDFNLPSPPPQPRVTYSTGFDRVNLFWDSGSRFNYVEPPGWEFEGYNVYQGASIAGPWVRVATFDVPNNITDVRDTVFDINTGLIINDQPVAFGGDIGVRYDFSTNQDFINGGTLKQGMTYYYAVTAYAVNLSPPRGLEKVLETSFQPTVVTVQRPPSGTDVTAARVLQAQNTRASGTPTTDHVIVQVLDPSAITGHTYCISFTALPSPVVVDGDTIRSSWTLTDRTTGEVLVSNQLARTSSPDYAPVDGMNVLLLDYQGTTPVTPLNDVYYVPFRPDQPFHGVHAGLTYFEDSFGYASHFLSGIDETAQPELFPTVELRYGPTQRAYRYFRDETASGSPPSTGRRYSYQGFHEIPWQAWDVTNNRQLEIGFVERRITDAAGAPTGTQPATQDQTWNPDNSPLGGREYLQISLRQYTGNPAPELAQNGAIVGVDTLWLYGAWLYRTGNPLPGDKFVMLAGGNVQGTPSDTLCFATVAPARGQVALQRQLLDRIRVVPNPYYSRSAYELSPFNRIVKFTNLPETATIRIYNLAGQLVRTLRKSDASSSVLEWNLENENRLPVASGVYVYHVEVPNAGSTVGRVAIFMEKERLQNF